MTVGIEFEMVLRLLLATVLGAGIGLQRELSHKPAGMRTHILICLGCALFSIISSDGFKGINLDPSRVAAGVVTGIGFLGAGAIIRGEGGNVTGLPTAASIWAVSAIGLAAGAGMYLIATATAAISAIVLALPKIRE